jgi:hypothetical protein
LDYFKNFQKTTQSKISHTRRKFVQTGHPDPEPNIFVRTRVSGKTSERYCSPVIEFLRFIFVSLFIQSNNFLHHLFAVSRWTVKWDFFVKNSLSNWTSPKAETKNKDKQLIYIDHHVHISLFS